MNKAEYLSLVPNNYINKPTYMTVLSTLIQPQIDINDLLNIISDKLYIDKTNTYTLNLLGEIFNVSRFVTPPIYVPSFSWNILLLGWGQAEWGTKENTQTIVDDVLYRYLVMFKSKLTLWDGSISMLLQCLEESFPTVNFTLIDNLDMTITIYCEFNTITLYSIKQLLLNGALQLYITGVNIIWREKQ